MKGNKGITLIALVITIIVLLILAGISIAMLTGGNGLLTKATESKVENYRGEVCDRINTAINAAYAELLANQYGVGSGITEGSATSSSTISDPKNSAEKIVKTNGLGEAGVKKYGEYSVETKTTGDVVTITWTAAEGHKDFGDPITGKITKVAVSSHSKGEVPYTVTTATTNQTAASSATPESSPSAAD